MKIKLKLAILTSSLILILFVIYSLTQYGLISHWIQQTERNNLKKTVDEVAGYLNEQESENDPADWSSHRQFFDKLVRQDQLFRLLDAKGHVFLEISNGIPAVWIPSSMVKAVQYTSTYHGQDHLLTIRSPIQTLSFTGTIELATNIETADNLIERLNSLIVACGIFGIVFCALGGWFVARQLVKPIQHMSITMNRIKRQGLHERIIHQDNNDELSNLIRVFNEMMDELESSFNRQSKFIEDASHELHTPIAIIEGHLKLIHRWGKHRADVLDESLNAAIQETERLKSLASQLLVLQKDRNIIPLELVAPVNVAEVISSVIRNYRMLHPRYTFLAKLNPDIEICINRDHLVQMLIIVLDNAVRYSGVDKPILIRSQVDNEKVYLQVEDHGSGIPKAELPFVFERFYRVDKSRSRKEGGGNGLGLSIARELASEYLGSVSITSEEGKGTTVSFVFSRTY
ncbi:sensor histidine kinase [Cohnella candidum]|uniref:Signal transduction histidine-protein kinase ArlS n=1 Tax=Cohnella candidum TaxID=2674991 RepID=A0A3G3JW75_9BACL|nr:HAMP domain-containing histidine kinase [Cohnella candidum]AYQ72444.1 sensor histidine kinase [Cohnella candidum]